MSDRKPEPLRNEPQRSSGIRPYLDIGRITAAHGVGGEVRVFPLTDRPDRFDGLTECYLTAPDGKTRRPVRIQSVRPHPPFLLVRLDDVVDRTGAEQLRDFYLTVDRMHAITLPEGSHFICDLIGLQVVDTRFGALGRLKDVQQNLSHDVYVVSSEGQPDLLFPALKSIIHRTDLEAGIMEITLPDGLYEIYR